MLWEAVFLLVVLKIPVIYLCAVVWWAIKAEPDRPSSLDSVPVTDTPSPSPWPRRAPYAPRRAAPGRPGRRPASVRPRPSRRGTPA